MNNGPHSPCRHLRHSSMSEPHGPSRFSRFSRSPSFPHSPHFQWIDLLGIAGLSVLCALLARLTLNIFSTSADVALIWPLSGVALAALLLGGRKYWPGILLGAFAGNLWAGGTLWLAVGISTSSTLAALFSHSLLSRSNDFNPALLKARHFGQLVFAATSAACIGAAMASATLLLAEYIALENLPVNFLYWWQGNLLGMMLVTPWVLVWRYPLLPGNHSRKLESASCLVLTFITGQIIFLDGQHAIFASLAHSYWMFLFIAWASIRCDRRIAVLVLVITAIQTVAGTLQELGPFATGSAQSGLEAAWFYLALLTLISFSLSLRVTERKLNERNLREEKQLSDDIINSLPGVFYMLDEQGRLLRWNSRYTAISGYSDQELQGKPALECIAETDRTLIQERIQQVFIQGEATAESGFRCKDGRVIPYHFTGQRTRIGGRICLVGLGEDISENLAMKQAMDESETRYHLLFDTSVMQIFIMDRDGVILFANQSFVNFNGGNREALIGHSVYELLPPEKIDFYRQRHDLAITKNGGSTFEDYLPGPNGPCWISSQIEPARDSTGQVYGLQVAAFDNTSRRQAEEALRKNEELLKFALEGAGDAVWDWDIPAGRIQMTRRWNEMLGYDANETVPAWEELTHPEDIPAALAHRQQLLTNPEVSHETEMRVRCKDGHWKWVQTRAMLVSRTEEGQALRVVGTSRDINARKNAELARVESEKRYRSLFENNKLHIIIFDADGNILMINESNARMLGGQPADFIGKSLRELDPERAEENIQRYRHILQTGESMDIEQAFPLADGVHWFNAHLQPLANLEGKNHAVQVVVFDITERKLMENALRKSEELWKFALEGSGDAVWDWDVPSDTVTFSARWKETLGYTADDEFANWDEMIHPKDAMAVQKNRQTLLEGETELATVEARARCKDGRWKWFLTRGMVLSRDEHGKPLRIVGINTDITQLKEHQQQLEHVAHYDVLTNLPNRILLASRLQHAMAQSTRRNQALAVAYLDLDGFKAINDRFGHNTGDELLIQVAQRMKTALREGDTLARIGGDEFIAILTDLDQPQDCEPILQRLLQAAAAPVLLNESQLSVSASIGVTLFPGDGVDADQLIRHADQAMYQAKQAGKNRFHLFDVALDTQTQHHHQSMENIRQALARREFILHYQPKVNMRTGALVGVEALIRWQHPEQGLLAPAAFLPVIEGHELSVQVGEWVIDTALAQIAVWQSLGLQLPVSVNIDGYHLQHGDFAPRLASLLATHPTVDPRLLELEILESSAFEDLQQVGEVMHACRKLGVHFALDDFGTGYASLTYLKRLPAEWLKIDQSFVRDMLDDPDDLAIVEGVIGLAQAFQRHSIAEGVENAAHGELLLQLGCELAQGYGIARPMAASALTNWAKHWQPDASWQHWSKQAANRNNLAIAFAEVRHRHWLHGIAHALEGARETAPSFEQEACPLSNWLANYGNVHYGQHAAYGEILELHQRLHELGHELMNLQHQGKVQNGKARLASLQALQETLTSRLHALLQNPPNDGG